MSHHVRLIVVPYDSGRRGERMGAGPDALLAGGLADHLAAGVERVEAGGGFPLEIRTGFELAGRVAGAVRAAVAAGGFPLVLSGNCLPAAVGTVAGLGRDDIGVAWFDCHGDFNTPETTPTGFLDGMAVAALTGRCWHRLAAGVPGFRPVAPSRVAHLGGRDFDPGEREEMEAAGVAVGRELPAGLAPAGGWYVHVDLDALDPTEARVNGYQTPGGLTVDGVEELIRQIIARGPVRAAALTAYDPAGDPDRRAVAAAARIARTAVGLSVP